MGDGLGRPREAMGICVYRKYPIWMCKCMKDVQSRPVQVQSSRSGSCS